MQYVRSLAAAAWLLAGASGAARAADCQITPYSFQFGVDTSTQMTVKSGKVCGSNIRFGNGGGGTQLTVSQPPANGSAQTPTVSRWEYVSRRGFTGPDHFMVESVGETMTSRRIFNGTTHIDVAVTVTP